MMMHRGLSRSFITWGMFGMGCVLFGQENPDSLSLAPLGTLPPQDLKEVVILPTKPVGEAPAGKTLGSLDSYLAGSNSVNMIRRGSYAWEPMLNGMATERSVITVDGMRIYSACTDRMDPVTSYVETSNLSRARIQSGSSGAEHGGTIAGSIDLERRRSGFNPKRSFGGSASTGFESNNNQRIAAAVVNYSSSSFYTDLDITYRSASNYEAGHRTGTSKAVDFSQFTKYNLSTIAGYKLSEGNELEASLIFDKATDVGYPGLTMDVSLARAVIGSVQYRHKPKSGPMDLWETKVYANTITHVMDDSQRPLVPIRMDMPGWSSTQGLYTKLHASRGQHRIKATVSAHRNNSLAEMTMYPRDPAEPVMFMLTWPDITTLYSGLNVEDRMCLKPELHLTLHAGLGIHENTIGSDFGRRSLELFYPGLPASSTRWLRNAGASLAQQRGRFIHRVGMGFSERAPSISEGYGFYLLNANDNYDYLGDPRLRNEGAISMDISSTYERGRVRMKWNATYFHIIDYIIGKPRPDLIPMNMAANGVKVFEQLRSAALLNTNLSMEYHFNEPWHLFADVSYRHGQGQGDIRLPLIQPFQYRTRLRYEKERFFAEASVLGNTRNRNAPEFGETSKPGYLIGDLSLSKVFAMRKHKLTLSIGIENIMDHYYITFSNWAGIPSMGRNVYGHLGFKF